MTGLAFSANASALSGYANRMVLLEVTGGMQDGMRTSSYTMKVPFSRLSQTMQRINRRGGKITKVTPLSYGMAMQMAKSTVVEPERPIAKAAIEDPILDASCDGGSSAHSESVKSVPAGGGATGFGRPKSKRKRS